MIKATYTENIIASELVNEIRKYADDAEKIRRLHPIQLEITYTQNWFNLFVPKQMGGSDLSLVEGLKMEEAIAWIDGSLGWTVTLCSGANWFVGFLSADAARAIFSDPKVCLAGSGMAAGIAKETPTGYEINGYWKYATGAPHATVFTANCVIEKNGELMRDDTGNSVIRSFWFKKEEVVIHDDWNAMGMIATASNSFEVKNINVSKDREFQIDSLHCVLDGPIYKYPFMQFAETTLAVNILGMVIHFLELCEVLFAKSGGKPINTTEPVTLHDSLKSCKKRIEDARQLFYSVVERSWDELITRKLINDKLLAEVSTVSRSLAGEGRRVVNDLFPYCGMSGIELDSDLNRVWRNIQTACQHNLLR